MTSLRVIAGIAVGVALAAFALGSARLAAVGDGPAAPAAPAPPPAATAGAATAVFPSTAPPPAPVPAAAAARSAAARPRVAAGVLARAASVRAQERDAACTPPRSTPADAGVESIEIDWNAPAQEP